ncbi:MAG TPA: YihY/virulence factor BrkB family protein [Terriglobales bacterium]|nr:YihY/virulence factor BrkB family protein [Terriglobales bacterium]
MAATLRALALFRRALARSLEDDVFGVAKAAAYSAILTLFPALLVLASILAYTHLTEAFLKQASFALGRVLPGGTSAAALRYFTGPQQRPMRLLVTTSIITLWTASGVVMSWMEGFRYAYQLPASWGLIKSRLIALALVVGALAPMTFATLLVAFGGQIEAWVVLHSTRVLGPYILLAWTGVRSVIATLTSIAVIAVIYHFAVPRTQPWHSVLPGATLATGMWLGATILFGWYLNHVAQYSLIYGSLGVAIALLVWMYIVSLIILFGAEVNALLFPRATNAGSMTGEGGHQLH